MTWNQKLALGALSLFTVGCLAGAAAIDAVPDDSVKPYDSKWLRIVLVALCALLIGLLSFQFYLHFHDIHPVRYTRHIGVYVMGAGATATAGPIAYLGLQQVEALGLKATFQEVGVASAVVLAATFTSLIFLLKHYTEHYHTLK